MSATTIGILCGLWTMLGYGLMNGLSKKVLAWLGVPRTIFWRSSITVVITTTMVVFLRDTVTFDWTWIGLGLLFAVIGYIPYLSFLTGLEKGDVGLISSVANSSLLFATLFGLLLFHEVPSLQGRWGIGAIIIGIILLTLNFSTLRGSSLFTQKSGVPYAIIASIGRGLVYVLFKEPSLIVWPILMTWLITVANTLCSAGVLAKSGQWRVLPAAKRMRLLVLIAFLASTATWAYTAGITYADIHIVAALAFSNPLITFFYGYIVYGERFSFQQMRGALIVVLWVIAVALS